MTVIDGLELYLQVCSVFGGWSSLTTVTDHSVVVGLKLPELLEHTAWDMRWAGAWGVVLAHVMDDNTRGTVLGDARQV